MFQNFLKFLLFSTIFNFSQAQNIFFSQNREKFSLLRDLTCAVAADELARNPEMKSILLVEFQNEFPKTFSAEILKCLPREVSKVILGPRKLLFDNDHMLKEIPKESLVILVSDEVEKVKRVQK